MRETERRRERGSEKRERRREREKRREERERERLYIYTYTEGINAIISFNRFTICEINHVSVHWPSESQDVSISFLFYSLLFFYTFLQLKLFS